MSRSGNPNRILNTLSISLPDDRPITGIQIVENIEKCPVGFTAISRTYDQDQEADLWREGSFLKRKTERYLCLSKTQGLSGHIIEEIIIVNDKVPPEGYCLLTRTVDTEQKAWRKKQLCYRLVPRRSAQLAVTDIIVCSRLKKAPEGFSLAGEINGVIICYKMGNVQDTESESGQNGNSRPPDLPPKPVAPYPPVAAYPNLDNSDHDYEILNPDFNNRPIRPAPTRPAPLTPGQSTHTLLSTHGALEGVPFIINPRFMNMANPDKIVENLEKCPVGFTAISRTYDQDQEADLWREGSFLKRKTERYLCLSKTQGLSGHIIEEIIIVNDKVPPEGYCLLTRTVDTEQKAWRKKQLCYRLVPRRSAQLAVTDIIVCSRLKKAPEGFSLAGEINGVIICYKMGNVQDTESESGQNGNSRPPDLPPKPVVPYPPVAAYPNLDNSDHDYEILNPDFNNRPIRPAPTRPAPLTPGQSTHTLLSTHGALEGVPFIINPRFMNMANPDKSLQVVIKARNMQQLMKDYDYCFTVERQ